ncbi:MAG TPA: site-2 protease family protein, partial [Pyrinomonadaceae bacterium]|nr:site-2 protease family protein [Pyrinomonadaceae bacterium]
MSTFVGREAAAGDAWARPTAREWRRHGALFLLTFVTATFGGITFLGDWTQFPEPQLAEPVWWFDYLIYLPAFYTQMVVGAAAHALAHPSLLAESVTFAAALLTILAAHEAGHYLACRRYGVEATLPYFIPAPPLSPGTFGAFIKIKSPIRTRRALFDIGVAGPLAGFVVLLPVAVAGIMTSEPYAGPLPDEGVIYFNNSLLLELMSAAFGVDLINAAPNPFNFAAWMGLLVTSLNLLPVGQLDGGHATFALFGARRHRLFGRVAFAVMLSLAVLGWFLHNAPSGFLYALLLFVMLRIRHPPVEDQHLPLGRARTVVAVVTLLVFLLSFIPFPITI